MATTAAERQLHQLVNGARASYGLHAVRLAEKASRYAHAHSGEMARSRTLAHSCLPCRFPNRVAAENVGVSSSVQRVHELLMASDGHRANILRTDVGRVGIGVYKRGGETWVTQVFLGRKAGSRPEAARRARPA